MYKGQEICYDYINNKMSLTDIAEKYLESKSRYYLIARVLKLNKIELRNKSEIKELIEDKFGETLNGRKYSINYDYFKYWSNNMAYILGFLASDGNICKNKIKIQLQYDDIQILNDIKYELEYTGEVTDRYVKYQNGKTKTCCLNISSKKMCEDLIKLGITPNKSLTLNMDNIPNEYAIDFIRGYFDGDGSVGLQFPTNSRCVRTSSPQIRVRIFSGSNKLIENINNYMQIYGFKNKTINSSKTNRNNPLYEICYSTNESIKIYELFYKNKDCLKLDRKYNKFTEYINLRNEYLKNKNINNKN